MRSIFAFILVTIALYAFSLNSFAQDSSIVKWTSESKQNAAGSYNILLKGQVKSAWHIYAVADTEDGLSGIVVSIKDSTIRKGALILASRKVDYKDPIFEKSKKIVSGNVELSFPITITGQVPASIKFLLTYETADKENFIPEEQSILVKLEGGVTMQTSNRILISSININKPLTDCKVASSSNSSQETKSKGLLTLFALGFLGGLVALLTPCVFPMIPLTVSFFTKKATTRKAGIRNAFLYGFFIFFIYVLLSVPFHFLDSLNPEILNNISTNVYLNVFFFVIFIVFAFSFFGYYEISLPGSMSSGADSKASSGNIAGIFFMALTLALVSFSCTGPILGSLLAGSLSADGGAMQLTSGMAGFGLALALPFALFALFPNLLHSLPKSGGWLNTVKVVLGFVELALAFKFLSNADLVMHWGILKREIFIGIWILTGAGLTLYLFGFIRFRHDSPMKKLPLVRLILAIITGLFTLYLLPGVTNSKWANLSLISGFPPPLYYSIYHKDSDCILSLNCTKDYEEGLRMAREQNKPMLIDFTGYACVNCRRMEENVWTKPGVYNLLKEKFIIVSLYVDDKKELPGASQFTYTTKEGLKKEIVTVGDKWATFETENFSNNAQPWYAILNTKEELLTHPVGYVPNDKEYEQWLLCGADAFYREKD
jgi:thiol:disulfide interchange protein DsbD